MANPPQGPSRAAKGSRTKPAGGPKRGARAKPTWKTRLLTGLKVVTIAGLVLALLGMGGLAIAYQRTDFPDPNSAFQTEKTTVFFRDGTTPLGSFAEQNRTSIPYAQMPQSIKDAVIAAENRDFWTDKGISPTGIARAAWYIARGKELQGGSTITQQYIKILYLTSDRTPTRKLTELLLAVKMGRAMPKEQVLEGYLNTIYFGRGAYGIQAAAKAYYNKDAKDLTYQESAVLASVLNNPSLFDPSVKATNVNRLTDRYRYVIDGMAEMGKLTEAQRVAAQTLPPFPDVPKSQRYGGPNGYLLKAVEAELAAANIPADMVSGGGLKIITTFDAAAQQAAVESAQKYTAQAASAAKAKPDPKQLHAALASVEVGTGEVLAMYGGPDYLASSRNWATTDRMAASTFKTYAVIAGLRNGFNLRTQLNGNTFTPKGDTSTIRNEFSMQYGQVSLVKATADSINTAFVDLTQQIKNGPQEVIKAANDAGVPTGAGWDPNNRISLGTAEVSPLDQATGYATIANNGVYVATHVVREVRSAKGEVLYKATPEKRQAFDADLTRDVTFALQNVVNEGTGARVASLGRDIAGKTGTAGVGEDVLSSWFVAYTKQVSTAVMYVAGDAGTADLDPYARPGDATFFGGTYPALTWLDYMQVAMKGRPDAKFDPPAYINGGRTPTPSAASSVPASSAPPSTPPPTSGPPSAPTTSSAPPASPTSAPSSAKPTTPPTQVSAPPVASGGSTPS